MAWARRIVVGLNLCPFAEKPLNAGRVRIKVDDACNEDDVMVTLDTEIKYLLSKDEDELSTTIIVYPSFAAHDFSRFYTFSVQLEDVIESDPLSESIMLAFFHPLHTWGDADVNDPVNFDKRAPYPIVNILRTEQVDRYVNEGRTQGILERNKRKLQSIGVQHLRQLYQQLMT